ncbi:hypothetical protein BGZ60DRAFT_514467 [Tricladium varicosporioides]|nr:hypothetical protein BGZ60DRAFT_514467 [Hymenoscyphus varicosporioides]
MNPKDRERHAGMGVTRPPTSFHASDQMRTTSNSSKIQKRSTSRQRPVQQQLSIPSPQNGGNEKLRDSTRKDHGSPAKANFGSEPERGGENSVVNYQKHKQRSRSPSFDGGTSRPLPPRPSEVPHSSKDYDLHNMAESTERVLEKLTETQNKLKAADAEIEALKDGSLLYRRLQETEARLDSAVAELSERHLVDPFRQPDDKIGQMMSDLSNDIRHWSKTFHHATRKQGFTQALKERLTGEEENPFARVTPQVDYYLEEECEKGLSLIVQGYVWSQLIKRVFGFLIWTGGPCYHSSLPGKRCPINESFEHLYKIFSDSKDIVQHHHWRAQTSRLVDRNSPLHKTCISNRILKITKKIESVLRAYTEERDIFFENEFNKGANILLSNIVRAAVDLDRVLWQQKAYFRFRTCNTETISEVFQSTWMTGYESKEEDERGFMRQGIAPSLCCCPALVKTGNSEGTSFENTAFICKAIVDCSFGQRVRRNERR